MSYLKKIEIFEDLTDEELSFFSEVLTTTDFKPGEVALTQGEENDTLYLIKSGHFKVLVNLPGDFQKEIYDLKDNTFFGETSMLSSQPATAEVIATEHSQCYALTREVLNSLHIFKPEIEYKIKNAITVICSRRIDHNIKNIHDLLYKTYEIEGDIRDPSFQSIPSAREKPIPIDSLKAQFRTQSQIFNNLSNDEIQQILPFMQLFELERGYEVPYHKDPFCGIVLEGAIQVLISYAENFGKNIDVIGPGGEFGQQTFFEFKNPSMRTIVREDVVALCLNQENLLKIKSENHKLWYGIHHYLCQKTVSMLFMTVRQLKRIESEYDYLLHKGDENV